MVSGKHKYVLHPHHNVHLHSHSQMSPCQCYTVVQSSRPWCWAMGVCTECRALMNVHSHLCPPPPTCSAFKGEHQVMPHLNCPHSHPCSSQHSMTWCTPLHTPHWQPRPGRQVEAVEGREGGGRRSQRWCQGPHEPCIEHQVVCFSHLHHLNDQKLNFFHRIGFDCCVYSMS